MRGQTAVEYLMTYGWAILIILIVAGVLAYYGIFAPSGFLGESATGFTDIMVLSPWSLGADGVFTGNLENRVGETVNVTDVYIWSTTEASKAGTGSPTGGDVTLVAGEKAIINFTAINGVTGTAGNTYTFSVSITYLYGGVSFNSTGRISGTYS